MMYRTKFLQKYSLDSTLRGEDETCVHLTWGEDGLHVSDGPNIETCY